MQLSPLLEKFDIKAETRKCDIIRFHTNAIVTLTSPRAIVFEEKFKV